MKTLLIISIALLTSISNAFAGEGNLNSIISKKLKVPTELKNQKLDEKVNVQFKIDNNGTIILLNVETQNRELKKYVEKEFPKLDLEQNIQKKDAIYLIDLNFKVV